MTKVLALSEAVQKQMVRRARDAGFNADGVLRVRAVAAVAGGRSRRAVAGVLGCAPSTVVRAVERFGGGGFEALVDRRRDNGLRKVDADYLKRLRAVLDLRADEMGWQRPTWTREALALTMAEQNFALVAPCTVGRALRAIGARRGRPKPTVECPWPEALRDKVLRALRRLERRASEVEPVVFADEVDIHLNPKIGMDWMNRGTQRTVETPGKNDKHYLAGALDSRTRKLVYVDGTRKTGVLFCALLDEILRSYPKAHTVHVILDNYRIHTSKLVKRHLASLEGRIQLHFLPPYCPDHNRIEREWQELHANVTRNHRCDNMIALLVRVFLYLLHRNASAGPKPALRTGLPVAA